MFTQLVVNVHKHDHYAVCQSKQTQLQLRPGSVKDGLARWSAGETGTR
jgi:hypothetical protein